MSSCRNQFRRSTRALTRAPAGPVPASRARAVAVALSTAALVTAAACGGKDPYAPTATLETTGSTFVLYPLSRVRPPFNSALKLHTPTAVQPTLVALTGSTIVLAPNFDVAFDVDTAGRVVLLQPKQLVSAQLVVRTAFQTSTTPFDSLGAAPGGSYQPDSLLRVSVGQTVAVEAQGVECQNQSPFYAKLVVDTYDAVTGALTVRVRVDPNCGFRSFASGLPKS